MPFGSFQTRPCAASVYSAKPSHAVSARSRLSGHQKKRATQTERPCYPYEHGYLVVDPDDLFIPRPARTLSVTQHHHHGPIIAGGRLFGRGGGGDVAICNLRPARWCGTGQRQCSPLADARVSLNPNSPARQDPSTVLKADRSKL
jgi:hypothetical protein